MLSGRWQALATGDLARRLRGSLADILGTLEAQRGEREDPWTALLYEYADRANSSDAHAAAATRIFERAVAGLPNLGAAPTLYGGFTGVAWLASHLTEPEPGGEDPNAELDATLCTMLSRPGWAAYDLIGGLVGVGVYFLERLEVPGAQAIAAQSLARIVDRLTELATFHGAGTTWFTPAAQLVEPERSLAPNGLYNLGVAHGVPGIVGLLGEIVGVGVGVGVGGSRARQLLQQSVAWLLAQPPADPVSRFAPWIAVGVEGRRGGSRLGWCYGDLGVAAVLLRVARRVGEPAWEREAIAMARTQATRRDASTMVTDAGLCHGTAGIAHLFNRLYQATGDTDLADAARYWLERTLELREPGAGIAGYRSLGRNETGETRWEAAPGFLTGAAGIGLSLLAATTDIAPDWDRVLLVSVPPAHFGR
ncbi:MAG: lanthionine synthetase C family protein [Kofleriaceae bacterium]